ALEALAAAEVLVGGARHLAMLPEDGRERLAWRSPLSATLAELTALRPRPVVVLATGDPLWFGIGRLLQRHVAAGELRIVPHVSAFQEACSRLGWSMEDVRPVSVHGRSVDGLHRHLQPGRRLLVLTADGAAPAEIGRRLDAGGYGGSPVWVMEQLAGAAERIVRTSATELGHQHFADLNLMAIELACAATAPALPDIPGLPDAAFEHDGQLTKAEVRAVTLAALAPLDGQLLWDVGAGAGSVAIEWLRSGRAMRAIGIERDAERVARIRRNAARLGVPELDVRHGEAAGVLPDLAPPDAIFVGGGSGAPGLVDLCWSKLQPGGRLVVNAVTIAAEAVLLAFHAAHGGKLLRLAISRSEVKGGQLVWRPALPVTQLSARKPCGAVS
ncbi:MAG: precorrin-6y C5,15-methyltransferase (decarboxylating) subunit CbiE, partial [Geminicoccaceae bacterium]